MLSAISCIFVLNIIILIHELGHFVVAKFTGMKVIEFSLGFGPKFWSKEYKGTLYSLRLFPFGGFNNIKGTNSDITDKDKDSFRNKSFLSRFFCIFAGPFMNFILAFFIIVYIIFSHDYYKYSEENIIGEIVNNSIAQSVNLKVGDELIFINGYSIDKWKDIDNRLSNVEIGESIELDIKRNNEILRYNIKADKKGKAFKLGIIPKNVRVNLPVIKGLQICYDECYNMSTQLVKTTYDTLFVEKKFDVSGPVGISRISGKAAEEGILSLLYFTALISLNLGLMNLLPLPVLDGGYLLLFIVELIMGKEIDRKICNSVQNYGVICFGILAVVITVMDILKLLNKY